MKPPSVRLQLIFDLDLTLPADALGSDPAALQRRIAESLGAMVLQGLPTIAAKQLAKADIAVAGSAHRLSVTSIATEAVDPLVREAMVASAPHLTDDEYVRLAVRIGDRLSADPDERSRMLRRQALAIANEFRLVPCVVHAVLTSEQPGTLDATLNLTNGSVMVEAHDRSKRLLPGQHEVEVEVPAAGLRFKASYAGHTISGPVIEAPVCEIARHRDALIGLWQKSV